MLSRVIARVGRSTSLSETVVATTNLAADDAIVVECDRLGIDVFRGSEVDVLDRYFQASRRFKADLVVRVTSDCPLIDPEIIDRAVQLMASSGADYASNVFPRRTFPRGLDVEVFSKSALETAWRSDKNPSWREHVTPFIYFHPEKFRIVNLCHDSDESHHRWTVDTPEDLEVARLMYRVIGHDRFTLQEAIAVAEANPEFAAVSAGVVQKEVPL